MTRTWRIPELAWLGLILAVGALVRLWHISNQSPFLDEAFSLRIGAEPIGQLLHDSAAMDVQPPAFYLLTHLLVDSLHWPLAQYRLLTAPLALVTVLATWAIARRFGLATAVVASLLVALMPGMIIWDRLFRMYSLWTALTAVSWWLLVLAGESQTLRGKAWRYAGYAAIAVALTYVHYLGAITLLTQAFYAAASPRTRWPVFAVCAAAFVAFVPWLPAARAQFALGATGVNQGLPWDGLFELFALGVPTSVAAATVFQQAVAIFVVGAAIAGAVLLRKTVVVYWLSGFAVQAIAGFALHKDLLVARYLFALAPALAIAAGAAVQALIAGRARVAAIAGAAALVTLECVGAQNVVLDPYYQFTDWFSVNATVLTHEAPGDAFMFVQAFPIVIVRTFSAFSGHPLAGPNVPQDVPKALTWIARQRGRRIWYVENQPDFADPDSTILRSLSAARPRIGAWLEPKAYPQNAVLLELYGAKR